MDRRDQTSMASGDDEEDTSDPLRQGKERSGNYKKQQTDG